MGQGLGPMGQGPGPTGQGLGPMGQGLGPTGQGPGPTGQGPGPTGQGPGPTGQGPGPTGQGPGPTGQGPGPTGQGPGPTSQEPREPGTNFGDGVLAHPSRRRGPAGVRSGAPERAAQGVAVGGQSPGEASGRRPPRSLLSEPKDHLPPCDPAGDGDRRPRTRRDRPAVFRPLLAAPDEPVPVLLELDAIAQPQTPVTCMCTSRVKVGLAPGCRRGYRVAGRRRRAYLRRQQTRRRASAQCDDRCGPGPEDSRGADREGRSSRSEEIKLKIGNEYCHWYGGWELGLGV